jgi:GT2 family glycosyltransferase
MYHEDTDLGWRFWLADWRVVLAPKSIVFHKYEFSRSIRKFYFMERNRIIVLLQNYKVATIMVIAPALLVMNGAMLINSIISGWWKEELSAYGYFINWSVWKNIFTARHAIQLSRKQRDRDVISHFTGRIEFQDVDSPLLRYVVNPVFNAYWQLVKKVIWW